jgi:hypothetical protein
MAAVLLAALLLLAWLAPAERTLGDGIKVVYVHVAFTWTGMVLLGLAAILGVAAFLAPRRAWAAWQARLFGLGLAFFGLGFGLSLAASLVNWGGVPVREPRFLTSLNVLVIGLVGWGLAKLLAGPRLAALLRAAPVVFLIWSVRSSTVVLHPDSPVSTAPPGIRYTFLGMFALALALAGWWLWRLNPRAGTDS